MRKLIILLLFIPLGLGAQDIQKIGYRINSRDRGRINETITQTNTNVTNIATNVTGLTTVNARVDSSKNLFNYETSYIDVDSVDIDSAKIIVLDYSPPHGSLNFSDSATVIALTINVWAKVTGPAGDLFVVRDNDDITIAGDSITIVIPGDYLVWVGLSFDGTNGSIFHVAIYKNGVVTDWEMHRKTSANDTGNMGMPAYIENLVAGDDLSLWIENTGNSNDATMISGQIVITMLHPD